MTFGKRRFNVHVGVLTIVLMGPAVSAFPATSCLPENPSVPEADTAWTIDRLLERLPQGLHHVERFRETYTSHLLTHPTVKKGTLRFIPPSTLVKHVTSPFEEIFTAEGETLRYENPEQDISTTFAMQDVPTLSVFIQGLRSLFTGNVSQLRQHFHLTLTGTSQTWTLNLRPVNMPDSHTIDCIQFMGTNSRLRVIEVREVNGDHSELLLLSSEGQ